jgi:GNAT superfamily N-acetyltransferase
MLFVDLALAHRLEMAHAWRGVEYARAQRTLHPDVPVKIEPVAGGYAIYAGEGSPLNRAVGVGLSGPVSRTDVEFVEQFYASCGAPSRVDLCPLADPSLLHLLKSGGYHLEQFFSVLVRALAEGAVPAPLPAEVRISRAGPAEAELWITTVAQGFGDAEVPAQETLDLLAPNFHSTNGTCFFAWMDGQPAGGGAIYIHGGTAEVGSTSTRPAFRRRGVQTALLQAQLVAAREQGCDLVLTITAPGSDSQRNMERSGFRLAYTKAILVA